MAVVYKNNFLKRYVILIGFVFLVVSVTLGCVRFYSARLAFRLDAINKLIERCSIEEMELWQEFSVLVTPIKVYSYCKEKLGMEKMVAFESLNVNKFKTQVASVPVSGEQGKSWRGALAWLLGGND